VVRGRGDGGRSVNKWKMTSMTAVYGSLCGVVSRRLNQDSSTSKPLEHTRQSPHH